MKKLVTTPLTNTIYWATVNEQKGMITGEKKDVTDNAIDAVFQHLIGLKGFEEKGFAGYEIPKKNSDSKVTMCVFNNDKYVLMPKGEVEDESRKYRNNNENSNSN